ncbi:MAG TPA: PfkB family carbohydrate kinase [Isosphaeraceae bacterium]|nr:PfkB family carbohydrate kinase [Isosphaeraceae bacterium]
MSQSPRVIVFGPAYLDRVLRVDRPLVDQSCGGPLDQSAEGRWEPGEGLALVDPLGSILAITLARDWPGPTGTVRLARPLLPTAGGWERSVATASWHDDLGGMGAGYASALPGTLVSAVGSDDDPTSRWIVARLASEKIAHWPVRVPGHPADWTLLVTSGTFGDKLPVGFRGCHAAIEALSPWLEEPCDLRVVAALPNRLAAEALRSPGARIRFFAPAMRNMGDSDPPLVAFGEAIDFLSCNRREWDVLSGQADLAARVPLVAITDGPRGSLIRYHRPDRSLRELRVEAFPRLRPPADTNRAGEAYASTLLKELLAAGWEPGPVDEDLLKQAATRASAAAALVLDHERFGFPSSEEVDRALRIGSVGGDDSVSLG